MNTTNSTSRGHEDVLWPMPVSSVRDWPSYPCTSKSNIQFQSSISRRNENLSSNSSSSSSSRYWKTLSMEDDISMTQPYYNSLVEVNSSPKSPILNVLQRLEKKNMDSTNRKASGNNNTGSNNRRPKSAPPRKSPDGVILTTASSLNNNSPNKWSTKSFGFGSKSGPRYEDNMQTNPKHLNAASPIGIQNRTLRRQLRSQETYKAPFDLANFNKYVS